MKYQEQNMITLCNLSKLHDEITTVEYALPSNKVNDKQIETMHTIIANEGLGDIVEAAWNAIKKFFSTIGKFLLSVFGLDKKSTATSTKAAEGVIEDMEKTIEDPTTDEGITIDEVVDTDGNEVEPEKVKKDSKVTYTMSKDKLDRLSEKYILELGLIGLKSFSTDFISIPDHISSALKSNYGSKTMAEVRHYEKTNKFSPTPEIGVLATLLNNGGSDTIITSGETPHQILSRLLSENDTVDIDNVKYYVTDINVGRERMLHIDFTVVASRINQAGITLYSGKLPTWTCKAKVPDTLLPIDKLSLDTYKDVLESSLKSIRGGEIQQKRFDDYMDAISNVLAGSQGGSGQHIKFQDMLLVMKCVTFGLKSELGIRDRLINMASEMVPDIMVLEK